MHSVVWWSKYKSSCVPKERRGIHSAERKDRNVREWGILTALHGTYMNTHIVLHLLNGASSSCQSKLFLDIVYMYEILKG